MTKEKRTKNERLERGVKKVLSIERPEEEGRARLGWMTIWKHYKRKKADAARAAGN
jgi:hypothetical protein